MAVADRVNHFWYNPFLGDELGHRFSKLSRAGASRVAAGPSVSRGRPERPSQAEEPQSEGTRERLRLPKGPTEAERGGRVRRRCSP